MGLKVVIPVAGIGTRLRPHTHTLPKVLVQVAGRPMLGHILEELKKYDVDEVTLIIGYMGEKVCEYVTGAFDFRFRFVVQDEIKGLGHAIWLSAPGYRDSDDPLLIILGDTLFEADFDALFSQGGNWIGVKEVEDPRRFGVVVLEGDRIKTLVEKPEVPPTNLAVVGIYSFTDGRKLYECLDEVVEGNRTTKGEIQLTDALDMMIQRGCEMKPFRIREWHDCGKAETLLETNRKLLDRYQADGKLAPVDGAHPGCILHPPVAIAKGAKLSNSIIGPHVMIGEQSVIEDSIIRDSVISRNVRVSRSVLRESIIADHAVVEGRDRALNIGEHSVVEHS